MTQFQAFDRGYDVTFFGTDDAPKPNARLHFPWPGDKFVSLWVIDVSIDFGLAGSTAQSRTTRSFFPHNSIPPVITVQCIAPNQFLYGKTLETIRSSHRNLDTACLHVFSGGIAPAGSHHKGQHDAVAAEGYVQNARRHHTKHEYAPEFTIEFTVSNMISPYKDQTVDQKGLLDWHDITQKIIAQDKNSGFAEDPDVKTPRDRLPSDLSDETINKRTGGP